MDELELPAEDNPFGRKHLLRQLGIAVVLAAVVFAVYWFAVSTAQRLVDAGNAPPETEAPPPVGGEPSRAPRK